MFWDTVAGVYDIFVNVINRKTHRALREIMAGLQEIRVQNNLKARKP